VSVADSDLPHGIVVGVDGSSWSRAAVRWAMAEATLRGVDLTIAHVVTPLSASTLLWPGGRIPEEVLEVQDNDARTAIADAIKIVQEDVTGTSRPQVRSEMLYGGVVPSLTGFSRSAELIVVGPRGRNEQHRRLLGSVASGLLHHARCPVAIVHATGAARVSGRSPVLLGTDGSPASEFATEIAFREAALRGVDVVALHVLVDADMSGLFAAEWSALQAVVQKPIAERLGAWEERYPETSVNLEIEFDRPADALIAASEGAQLVVLGSRGRGGFTGMLLGSVSSAVAQEVRVPIIVARPR